MSSTPRLARVNTPSCAAIYVPELLSLLADVDKLAVGSFCRRMSAAGSVET